MWKVLICDDDNAFLQEIKKDIVRIAGNKVKDVELFEEKEKLEFYIADRPNESNIVILDVKLGADSGIELAETVLRYQPNTQIIFVSGYDDYYLDVYDVDHVYFLKKPIDEAHLGKAIARAGDKLRDLMISTFTVANKQGMHHIPFNEILCFENERRRIHVHTPQGKLSFYGRFEDLMEQLDKRFMRCHNSYIVNITRVRELSNKKMYFENEKVVPVSKTYYTAVREAFLEHLGEDFARRGVSEVLAYQASEENSTAQGCRIKPSGRDDEDG